MPRTQLSPKRLSDTKDTNIGNIILFCEGMTEKHYLDYFSKIIEKDKFTDIEIISIPAKGNAQTVLNEAETFFQDDDNNRKYFNYSKYLMFDCDDPPTIQKVINDAKNYKLLISNPFFETWLLMYFEDFQIKLTKRQTYKRLSEHLNKVYKKGNKGTIRQVIANGNFEKAIDNARMLTNKYASENKSIFTHISEMNPYADVYELIEEFMRKIS